MPATGRDRAGPAPVRRLSFATMRQSAGASPGILVAAPMTPLDRSGGRGVVASCHAEATLAASGLVGTSTPALLIDSCLGVWPTADDFTWHDVQHSADGDATAPHDRRLRVEHEAGTDNHASAEGPGRPAKRSGGPAACVAETACAGGIRSGQRTPQTTKARRWGRAFEATLAMMPKFLTRDDQYYQP